MQLNCIMSDNKITRNETIKVSHNVDVCRKSSTGEHTQFLHPQDSEDLSKRGKLEGILPKISYPCASSSDGGRLKFFLDGKTILELLHQPEGDQPKWVQVKERTYWPPLKHFQSKRHGSCTSQSVSDDGSSVNSSPWLRDHKWKQVNPKKYFNSSGDFMMHTSKRKSILRYIFLIQFKKKKIHRNPLFQFDLHDRPLTENSKIVYMRRKNCRQGINNLITHLHEKVHSSHHFTKDNSENAKKNPQHALKKMSTMISPRKRILREIEEGELKTKHFQNHDSSAVNYLLSQCTEMLPKTRDYSIDSLLNRESDGNSFLRSILAADSPGKSSAEATCNRHNVPANHLEIPSGTYKSVLIKPSTKPESDQNLPVELLQSYPSDSMHQNLMHPHNLSVSPVIPSQMNFIRRPSYMPSRSQVFTRTSKLMPQGPCYSTLPMCSAPMQDVPLNLSLNSIRSSSGNQN